MKFMKIIGATLFALSAGCSKLNIAYDFGSYKLKNSILDSYAFKKSESDQKIRALWNKNLTENKKLIFKNLNLLIIDIQKETLNTELTSDSIESLYTKIKIQQKILIGLFSTTIESTINEVGTSEVENFKIYSLEKINEYKYTPNDIESRFLERTESVMDYLFDTITKEQLQISKKFFEDNKLYLLGQKERRINFINMFTSLFPDKEKMKSYMISYYSADDSIRSPEYKKEIVGLEANSKNFILNMWASLTAKQKKEFQKTLAVFKEQLDTN